MTAFTIGTVRYKNFGPFIDAAIDFSKPGLTLIEGRIDGVPGCDSNGAGKSFLFDGVAFALYGRCIREKYDGDNVIRLGAEEDGACVEVTLVNEVRNPIAKVIRYRKDPHHKDKVFLEVGDADVTRGTNPQTTLAIENLVGMDFTAFANSVAFGVREDVRSFFASPDSERKRILDKILGLELYAEAQKVAQGELRMMAAELNTAEEARIRLNSTITEQKASLDAIIHSEASDDLAFKLREQQAKVKAQRKAVEKAQTAMQEVAAEVDAEEEKAKAAFDAFQIEVKDHNKKLAAAQQAVRNAERAHAELVGQVRYTKEQRAKWDAVAGKQCLTCQQPVSKTHVHAITEKIDAELAAFEEQAAKRKNEVAQARMAQAAIEEAEPEAPVHRSTELIQQALTAKVTEHRILQDRLQEALNRLQQLEDHQHAIDVQANDIRHRIAASEKELAAVEAGWATKRQRADALTFWTDGFGNGGIKSFLIEAEIPEINRRATKYAQRLLGTGATVRLSATKELKTKQAIREELTVEGSIPGLTKSYAGASKGQKHRLDLSLLLAFRDTVSERSSKSFRQLFADELFDGVDKTGCESVVELLREVAAKCPVCLVTHESRLKPVADRVVLIHHSKGTAAILARGAGTDTNAKTGTGLKQRILRDRRAS